MTDTPQDSVDKFAVLFDLAGKKGSARNELLNKQSVQLAGMLAHQNEARWADLLTRLSGWTHRSKFSGRVEKWLRDAIAKRDRMKAEDALAKRLEEAAANKSPILVMNAPLEVARSYLVAHPHVLFVSGEWLEYEHNCYVAREPREVRASLQAFIDSGVDSATGEKPVVTRRFLDDVVDALTNVVFKPERFAKPPVWFDHWEGVDSEPTMTIACANGLLDVAGGVLHPHSSRFFTRNGLTFGYDPTLPPPARWMAFLEDLWPEAEGGAAEKAALQEVFGYLLSGDTHYQKIFSFVGAPGSGKGTIARVLEALLGSVNVVTQKADKLGTEFGLHILLGKSALIVTDLRFGKGANIHGIIETLLTISGEDAVAIGRKHKDDVLARLNTRIVLMANKAIQLPDQSGAFARRLVPLVFTRSFTGREDIHLTDKLKLELPGILNWSLEGLRRLRARVNPETGLPGTFVLTEAGAAMLQTTTERAAPVRAFLAECCVVAKDDSLATLKPDLLGAFEGWAEENDVADLMTPINFPGELETASGYVIRAGRTTKLVAGRQKRAFINVALKPEYQGKWEPSSLYPDDAGI